MLHELPGPKCYSWNGTFSARHTTFAKAVARSDTTCASNNENALTLMIYVAKILAVRTLLIIVTCLHVGLCVGPLRRLSNVLRRRSLNELSVSHEGAVVCYQREGREVNRHVKDGQVKGELQLLQKLQKRRLPIDIQAAKAVVADQQPRPSRSISSYSAVFARSVARAATARHSSLRQFAVSARASR